MHAIVCKTIKSLEQVAIANVGRRTLPNPTEPRNSNVSVILYVNYRYSNNFLVSPLSALWPKSKRKLLLNLRSHTVYIRARKNGLSSL